MGIATPSPSISPDDLQHVFTHVGDAWQALRGRRLFITGGTGFVGCWLLDSFAWANDQLGLGATASVLTRDPRAFAAKSPYAATHAAVKLCTGDVCSCPLPGEPFDFIIHAASEPASSLECADQVMNYERMVAATKRVLELARTCGTKRLLFASSGAVYGRQPSGIEHVSEDYPGAPDPMDPISAYGQGKRISEFLCSAYAQQYGFEATIARCFAFTGPHLPLDAHYAVGNFIRDALSGGPINVNGDGTPFRSYLYAADLAIWLWTILLRGRSCRTYNVGSDVQLSIRQLADEVRSVVAPQAEVKVAKQAEPERQAERYVPSIQRARTELGLDVRITLRDAIARTAAWHRNAQCQAPARDSVIRTSDFGLSR